MRLETKPSSLRLQAARKRSGPTALASNGLTKMPSGRPRNTLVAPVPAPTRFGDLDRSMASAELLLAWMRAKVEDLCREREALCKARG